MDSNDPNNQSQPIPNELMDPIMHSIMDDPIILPCCGRAISRQSIITNMQYTSNCPLCQVDLTSINFNPQTTPRCINLAYQIEAFNNVSNNVSSIPTPLLAVDSDDTWTAKVDYIVTGNTAYQTVIGELDITNPKFKKFFNLFIPVVDTSGSMSGNPIAQVQFSLNRMIDLVFNSSNIIANIIHYSHTASSIKVLKTQGIPYYANEIAKLSQIMGGTVFKSAFDEILKVADVHKNDDLISQMTIMFLTDGEGEYHGQAMIDAVEKLKKDISAIWKKPFVVHSIGFGTQHDFNFLDKLRMIGTSEGAYKYADPSENNDSLSNKIQSILNVVSQSTSIPIKIKETTNSLPILGGEDGKYWVNLSGWDSSKQYDYDITIGDNTINVPVSSVAPYEAEDDSNKLQDSWYSFLIDQIANELLPITNKTGDKSIDDQIHLELLVQRSKALSIRLDSTSSTYSRLMKLMEFINTITKGGTVDQMKLNDMKSEGKFKTVGDANKQGEVYRSSVYGQLLPASEGTKSKPNNWIVIKKGNRLNSKKRIFVLICSGSNDDIKKMLHNPNNKTEEELKNVHPLDELDVLHELDDHRSNILMLASSIGKKCVKDIVDIDRFDINAINDDKMTALDLAILHGYWMTVEYLISKGAKTNQNGQLLLRTCLANKYVNTASKLLKHKIAYTSDDMINDCPTTEGIEWLSNNSSSIISLDVAVIKGLYDKVEDMTQANTFYMTPVSFKTIYDIIIKPQPNHIRILDLLLEKNLFDPLETIEVVDPIDQSKEITWPLFAVCEKGVMSLFSLFLKYYDVEALNKQNNKGTTALWIACCNRHIDIVAELLHVKADPNLANIKGDTPLIPACQKGNTTIVQMLIESGIDLNSYNKNRDSPILICCRTGQAKILDLLLATLPEGDKLKAQLELRADIDGHDAILASVELDKVDCIKVCLKYGSDIETRTLDTSDIIKGATSVHLACHYNRVASLRFLYESKANILAKTNVDGSTCMHIAIQQGHKNVIEYLLSLKEGREMLNITDNTGRLPQYYATTSGNEHIFEEFFVNKLSVLLERSLFMDADTERKCANVLEKYGKSLSIYHYEQFTEIDMGKGETLLVKSLLNGNKIMTNTLLNTLNANINKNDDMKISPLFWMTLLHLNESTNVDANIDRNVQQMISRLKVVADKSMQNKLLTNIQVGTPKLILDASSTINTLTKMNDGFSIKIKNDVLSTLKSFGSRSYNHSLLSFIEKIKGGKDIVNGKNVMEYIIWQGKVHLIKVIASSDQQILEPHQIMALYLYTSSIMFYNVNKTLMNWNDKSNEVYKPYIGSLYQAINLLESHKAEVYRAVDTTFNVDIYKVGQVISWNAFSICSKSYGSCNDMINSNKGIIFIIQSLTGRNVSQYSENPANEDIIFLPESKFMITDLHVASQICLAQSNIRTSTYAINDKNRDSYFNKVFNGQASIIVALQEVDSKTSSKVSIEEIK